MKTDELCKIRNNILEIKGQDINLKAVYGRRGKLQCNGVVDGVYNDIFTVKVHQDGYERKYCYTYSEVFTNNVQINAIT